MLEQNNWKPVRSHSDKHPDFVTKRTTLLLGEGRYSSALTLLNYWLTIFLRITRLCCEWERSWLAYAMIYDTKLMIGNRFRAPIFGSKRVMRVVGWCLLEKNNHCVGAAFTFQLLVFYICLRANSPSSCVAFMRYTLRRPSVRPRVLDLTVIFHIFIYYLFIRLLSA